VGLELEAAALALVHAFVDGVDVSAALFAAKELLAAEAAGDSMLLLTLFQACQLLLQTLLPAVVGRALGLTHRATP